MRHVTMRNTNSPVGHFLTRYTFDILVLKNTIKNQKFHFLTKICKTQNKR